MSAAASKYERRAEQAQAAQHVFDDADIKVKWPDVEVPIKRILIRPAHVHQNRDQQRRVRDNQAQRFHVPQMAAPNLDQAGRST